MFGPISRLQKPGVVGAPNSIRHSRDDSRITAASRTVPSGVVRRTSVGVKVSGSTA